MDFARAANMVYDAIRYADRWVDENKPVEDIRAIVEKYLSDYGYDDEVMTVVETAADLLNAAAGHGSDAEA